MTFSKTGLIFVIIALMVFSACLAADNLDDILNRHLDAIGGRDAVRSLNSSIAYTSIVFGGLTGWQVVHYRLPFCIHAYVDFGVMSQELGFDGKTSWTVDPNGKVRSDIEEEMKPLINELYFSSYSYVIPGGHPGKKEYRGDTTINGAAFHNIAIFPQGGDSVSIFINKQTGMIEYRSEYIAGLKMITTFSDFRKLGGLKVPYLANAISPDGPLEISTRLDSVKLNPDIPDAVFRIPGDSVVDFRFPAAAASIDIPLEPYSGYLTVETRINGQGPFRFLLDTGAGMTIIAKATSESLGLPVSGELPIRGVGGFGSVGFVEIDSISLGRLPVFLKRVLVYDFSSMHGLLARWIDGVIGYDFFARFPLKINPADKNMTLYNPEFALPEFKGQPLEIEIFSQVPVVEAEVNGEKLKFLLDLGAQPGLVIRSNKKAMLKMEVNSNQKLPEAAISGVGGMKTVGQGKVDSLKIAGYLFENLTAIFIDDFSQLPIPDYIDGIIGLEILSQFELVLDYHSSQAILYKQ